MDVISEMNEDSKNIAIIGDRIFTDIIVGKLVDQGALLIEDDEFDKVQPLIESELEKSSL